MKARAKLACSDPFTRQTHDLYRSRGTSSTICNSKEQARSSISLVQKVKHYIIKKREALPNRFVHHATSYASSLLPASGIAMWDN